MKIKISKILLVLSVCGLLYSCDKFFEVDLKAQMDEEKVVNNEDYLARLWAGLLLGDGERFHGSRQRRLCQCVRRGRQQSAEFQRSEVQYG